MIPENVTIDGVTYKVTSIAQKAFKNNKFLTSVSIGNQVTTIGKEAFYNCKKLKTVTIGKGVKNIEKKTFYQCKSLKTITIKTSKLTKKTVGSKAFGKCNNKVTVKVPAKKWKAYKKLLKEKGIGEAAKIKK